MKLVKETLDEALKRGGNPLETMDVGVYRDNPMPEVIRRSEELMKDPTSLYFPDWVENSIKAINVFGGMILAAAIFVEVGVDLRAEVSDTQWDMTVKYVGELDGVYYELKPSTTGKSWYLTMEYNGRDISPGSMSSSADTLTRKIKTQLRKNGLLRK